MAITRRTFLRALAAGSGVGAFGGLGALSRLAHAAATTEDRYYIFCYFNGGWDILLSLDPRDPAVFTDGNVNATRIQPAYNRLPQDHRQLIFDDGTGITFGPYIGDLRQQASRLCIVRGLNMETVTHETGRRRFLTGKPPSGVLARGSSAATWLAGRLGEGDPIPNLTAQVESYNKQLPRFATGLAVDGVSDLVRALRPGQPALDAVLQEQVEAFLRAEAACTNAQHSDLWQTAEAARQKAAYFSNADFADRFDFMAQNDEMAAVRDHYNIPDNDDDLRSPEAQAAMAARAITKGVSRAVSIQVATNLDTHFGDWAANQGPRQQRGFDAVARLIDDLATTEYQETGASWLDHTVILGFSEFCRSAVLNASGGRDHSLTNACFLAGGNINGGRALGSSSDIGMTPQALDLATGETDAGGEIPRPEHVIQALFEEVGIGNEADLRVPPLRAILSA